MLFFSKYKIGFLFINIIFFYFGSNDGYGQQKEKYTERLKTGFNYGMGTQEIFPFNSKDYLYDPQFFKIQINYTLAKKVNWNFELNVEPSYYLVQHQLLNEFYVKPSDREDYLEKREEFTKKKQINEYVLNVCPEYPARYLRQ